MKDYGRIISTITTTPWMMAPSALKMMLEILDAHINGTITPEEIRQRIDTHQRDRESLPSRNSTVGVLPLHGPIFPKANLMTEMSGATSLEQWTSDFLAMVADDSISSIIIDVDSPGGLSSMVPETAATIRRARDVKPIYAVANTMMASAAYGISSGATKVFGSPSSMVGSIGTYMVHTDESPLMEKIGVKETVIKAGRFKAVEIESLTPESREYLQDLTNDVNDQFLAAIADGRGISVDELRETYGDGRVFASSRGLELGVIDGIATLDEVVGETLDGGGVLAHSFPAGRQSYDADKEHSEPGTGLGGEPTPREPPETGDPAIEGGWRRDTPPDLPEEEEAVNREWLEARANALGIEFNADTSDEDLAQAVAGRMDEINDLVQPLRDATQQAEEQREFAEKYPDQAARLARLEERDREYDARTFAESYQRIEGRNKGFSPVVREQIYGAHMAISQRTFNHENLTDLLNAVSSDTALVPLGETGSSREAETVRPSASFSDARQEFARLVRDAMTEDHMDQDAALAHVSKQHPELAKAYALGHVGR
jgi:signal peptide peptidase SppA